MASQQSRIDIHVPIAGPGAGQISAGTVKIAISTSSECPALDDPTVWHAATAYDVGGADKGVARYLIGPGSPHGVLPKGRNFVWAWVDAGREAPVVGSTIRIT